MAAEDQYNLGGGGWLAHIHIFVFTDCKNNRFQKKLIIQSTNMSPPLSVNDLPPPLSCMLSCFLSIKLARLVHCGDP